MSKILKVLPLRGVRGVYFGIEKITCKTPLRLPSRGEYQIIHLSSPYPSKGGQSLENFNQQSSILHLNNFGSNADGNFFGSFAFYGQANRSVYFLQVCFRNAFRSQFRK